MNCTVSSPLHGSNEWIDMLPKHIHSCCSDNWDSFRPNLHQKSAPAPHSSNCRANLNSHNWPQRPNHMNCTVSFPLHGSNEWIDMLPRHIHCCCSDKWVSFRPNLHQKSASMLIKLQSNKFKQPQLAPQAKPHELHCFLSTPWIQ